MLSKLLLPTCFELITLLSTYFLTHVSLKRDPMLEYTPILSPKSKFHTIDLSAGLEQMS